MTTEVDVQDFLEKMRTTTRTLSGIIVVRLRPESPNALCMNDLGINENIIKNLIFTDLGVGDYSNGPEADHNIMLN